MHLLMQLHDDYFNLLTYSNITDIEQRSICCEQAFMDCCTLILQLPVLVYSSQYLSLYLPILLSPSLCLSTLLSHLCHFILKLETFLFQIVYPPTVAAS